MPAYTKFLKEILSKKRNVNDNEKVTLTWECSAVLQKKLPIQRQDPGSYTIPFVIGMQEFSHALCDLGSSINLMPLSIFRELGVGVVKPTRMQLQLADHSLRTPLGIVEDVPVQVESFIFPVDFVVLDIEQDLDMPLILGRPFLQTGRAMVDMDDGKITLKFGGDQISFNVANETKMQKGCDDTYSCNRVTTVFHETETISQEFYSRFDLCEQSQDLEGDLAVFEAIEGREFTPKGKHGFLPLELRENSKLKPSVEKLPEFELKQLPSLLRYVFLGRIIHCQS